MVIRLFSSARSWLWPSRWSPRARGAGGGAAGIALALLLGSAAAPAQTVAPNVAVPYYGPADFVLGAYRFGYVPQAQAFAEQARQLPGALQRLCDAATGEAPAALRHARDRWVGTQQAWDRLAGVAAGPVLERRSSRQIDFAPTRPELIERAIRSAPTDAQAMERIGTPAKGLPALEWLLWTQPASAGPSACRYAVRVAEDLQREADTLAQAYVAQAAIDWAEDEQATGPAIAELVNQWVGGIERLRWASIEKPLRSAGQGPRGGASAASGFPRAASGQTAGAWAAQWQAVRALAVSALAEPPVPGAALVPVETYLRGRGLNPLADRLVAVVATADRALAGLAPGAPARLLEAGKALAALKRLVEAEVAPALQVNIGFSDADGD